MYFQVGVGRSLVFCLSEPEFLCSPGCPELKDPSAGNEDPSCQAWNSRSCLDLPGVLRLLGTDVSVCARRIQLEIREAEVGMRAK